MENETPNSNKQIGIKLPLIDSQADPEEYEQDLIQLLKALRLNEFILHFVYAAEFRLTGKNGNKIPQ